MSDSRTETPIISSTFQREGDQLTRILEVDGKVHRSSVPADDTGDPLGDWWLAYLRGAAPSAETSLGEIRTAELFCGSGGLAQGFRQACHETGRKMTAMAAVDHDGEAVDMYEANHRPYVISSRSVTELVDYRVKRRRDDAEFRYEPEMVDDDWRELVGSIDVVLAGPPCQGHSNLNNHSRRTDPRNDLYLSVPAVAIALQAPMVIIENVQAVVHDRLGVVAATVRLLEDAGYKVEAGVLKADQLGWAQRRSRYFLIASRNHRPIPVAEVAASLADDARPVRWAIDELADADPDDHMFRRPEMSSENRNRINYLFENDLHDLPNSERPDCHKDGTTYTSVYGRLHGDKPAPTITTGFMTPGRGRYIHHDRRRVLAPQEAARIQGFPDNYLFASGGEPPSSVKLSKWIGDAVPMPLGFAAGLSVLGGTAA